MAERDKTDAPDLKAIRDEFDDACNEWQDIRDEGAIDMRYVAGDPWVPADKAAREKAGRPAVTYDELGQYINQLVNDVRQNKRGIVVSPEAAGADSKTAEYRQGRIRQIEYKSNAQQAYTTMFENAVQRSYGFLRIVPEYADYRSGDQELRIKACENPDLVTPDPYAIRPDGSDWKFLYFAESWKVADFKQKYGKKAAVVDFGAEYATKAPRWIKTDRVLVAERWKVDTRPRKLLLVQVPPAPQPPGATPQNTTPQIQGIFADELQGKPLPPGAQVVGEREVDYPFVTQQITNGIEILDEMKWPGTCIPFVACYGKVLYVDEGDGAKRKLLSLVRLAREPFLSYCFLASAELENISTALKFPYFAYEGQVSPAMEAAIAKSVHEPVALIKVKPWVEGIPVGTVLPFPQRTLQEPQVQAIEIAKESCRRAIQAAMGSSPLPTQAQRHNEKSGVALKQIEDTAQRGSFHFIDHYDDSLTRTGTILNELIPHYEDNARTVTVRKGDDSAIQVRINDPNDPTSVDATTGLHDVTISVGPAVTSEREAASEFADAILASPFLKAIEPAKVQHLIALAIKLKAVGPLGDEMADIISPPEDEGQITPQMVQQLKQQVQMLQQQLQQAAQEIKAGVAKEQVKAGVAMELAKLTLAKDLALQRMKDATTIRAAEITATKETVHNAIEDETEAIALHMEQAHTAIENEKDRAHELAMAAVGAQQQQDSAAQDHQQGLEAGDVAHQQALEQGDAAHGQALEQQANQAALTPPETGA